jgi:hypothetical protein
VYGNSTDNRKYEQDYDEGYKHLTSLLAPVRLVAACYPPAQVPNRTHGSMQTGFGFPL